MTLNPKYHDGAVDYVGDTSTEMIYTTLELTYEIGDFSLISVSSWYDGEYLSETDTDDTSDSLLAFDWGAETNAISQDLRLVSNFDGLFNFIAGVYYGDEDLDTHVFNPSFFGTALGNIVPPGQIPPLLLSGNTLGNLDHRFDLEKESKVVYLDVNLDLSDRLNLNVGRRYTDDEITRDYQNVSRINGKPLALPPLLTGAIGPIITDPRTEGTFVTGNASGIPAPVDSATMTWTHGPLTNASAPVLTKSEGEVTKEKKGGHRAR